MYTEIPSMGMHHELSRMKQLDSTNKNHLAGYIRHLGLKSLAASSIKERLWRIYSFLIFTGFKDAKTVSAAQVEDYVIHRKTDPSRRGKPCAPATIRGDIIALRLFFRWLVPKKEAKLFNQIENKKTHNKFPVERLLNRRDVEKIVNACDTQRDRALVMILWDSGARITEILSRNVGNIEFDRYGAVMVVEGKTGQRRLRLTACTGDLQNWINIHPLRDDSGAPLFLTYNHDNFGRKRLNANTVRNRLKALAKHAGVTKLVHPHAFRHARLTDFAKQGFNEMDLRIIAGWGEASAMSAVYIHMSGSDIEKKILQKAGLADEADMKEISLEPIRCPRCKNINAYDSLFCRICSAALSETAAKQIDSMHLSVINNPRQVQEWALKMQGSAS